MSHRYIVVLTVLLLGGCHDPCLEFGEGMERVFENTDRVRNRQLEYSGILEMINKDSDLSKIAENGIECGIQSEHATTSLIVQLASFQYETESELESLSHKYRSLGTEFLFSEIAHLENDYKTFKADPRSWQQETKLPDLPTCKEPTNSCLNLSEVTTEFINSYQSGEWTGEDMNRLILMKHLGSECSYCQRDVIFQEAAIISAQSSNWLDEKSYEKIDTKLVERLNQKMIQKLNLANRSTEEPDG